MGNAPTKGRGDEEQGLVISSQAHPTPVKAPTTSTSTSQGSGYGTVSTLLPSLGYKVVNGANGGGSVNNGGGEVALLESSPLKGGRSVLVAPPGSLGLGEAGVKKRKKCFASWFTPSFAIVALVVLNGDTARGALFPTLWPLVSSLGGDRVMQGYVVSAFSFGR